MTAVLDTPDALLAITKTPADDAANGGIGCGDVGGTWDTVECLDRVLPGTELRRAAVAMTPGLVELIEERTGTMEQEVGMSRELADAAAATDTDAHEGDEESLLLSKYCATVFSMAELLNMMRKAIEASEQSRYRMSQETGIAQSVLSRFMSGETALAVETVERLADYLGLEIMVRPKKRGTRKGR